MKASLLGCFWLLLVGACFICGGSKYSCSAATGGSPPEARRELSPEANFRLLERVWIERIRAHEIDGKAAQMVWTFLTQVVEPQDCQVVDAEKLGKSLDRYLKQFKHKFAGEHIQGNCYWLAWLLANSAKRPPISAEEKEETRIWFQAFSQRMSQALDEKVKREMGSKQYLKYKSQIEEALDWTVHRLGEYYDMFHDDPLFPALKTPASYEVEKKLVDRIQKDGSLQFQLARRIPMMVLEIAIAYLRLQLVRQVSASCRQQSASRFAGRRRHSARRCDPASRSREVNRSGRHP